MPSTVATPTHTANKVAPTAPRRPWARGPRVASNPSAVNRTMLAAAAATAPQRNQFTGSPRIPLKRLSPAETRAPGAEGSGAPFGPAGHHNMRRRACGRCDRLRGILAPPRALGGCCWPGKAVPKARDTRARPPLPRWFAGFGVEAPRPRRSYRRIFRQRL